MNIWSVVLANGTTINISCDDFIIETGQIYSFWVQQNNGVNVKVGHFTNVAGCYCRDNDVDLNELEKVFDQLV